MSSATSPLQEQSLAPATGPRALLPQPAALVAMLTLSVLTLALTLAVIAHPDPLGPDARWLQWFIDHRSDTLTSIAKVISALGDTTTMGILAVLVCVLLAWRRQWETAIFLGIAALGAGVLTFAGKQFIGRDRPPVVDHLVTETNHSYPSGHTLGSTVVVATLVALALPLVHGLRRVLLVVVAGCFVLAVGFSRLYLGVHWPTDILGGLLFGALWLTICFTLLRPVAVRGAALVPKALRG
ncbi:MAG: Undecaprenyl-diphosphate phosphatase [Nocardia sp.]|uniref:phosphatase PAP2 family protein n=1 Tax=Nocardia sp. TaxID=1821 RepID=UPI002609E718|nr:phosphatase PAP2 family protein [Nocardia sp.]MCU1646915.1 Undecaprenyl-diphosphate phosphatase [Nocardia sp.]